MCLMPCRLLSLSNLNILLAYFWMSPMGCSLVNHGLLFSLFIIFLPLVVVLIYQRRIWDSFAMQHIFVSDVISSISGKMLTVNSYFLIPTILSWICSLLCFMVNPLDYVLWFFFPIYLVIFKYMYLYFHLSIHRAGKIVHWSRVPTA